jgi:hypothetical protein
MSGQNLIAGQVLPLEQTKFNICDIALVRVPEPYGLVCFLLNICVPGLGSMISSCFEDPCNGMAITFGVIQMASSWLLIGWLWSIYQGWLIYDLSKK